MRNVFLKVYGCKVNQYELQLLREQLDAHGFCVVSRLKDADSVLINTCTVTKGSDKELEYFIRKTKKDHPFIKIYLVGCYVNSHRDSLVEREDIDGFFANDEKAAVAAALSAVAEGGGSGAELLPVRGISRFNERTRAFIKIQDGCNRVCSYCIVRLVRGASRSRAVSDILAEARRLAANGYEEVVLAGVQIGAFGKDDGADRLLPDLLAALAEEQLFKRIRISSIEPFDITDALISCMHRYDTICNHLHISIQSGDDQVLSRMRRGYSSAYMSDRLRMLHEKLPGFAYSTDIIAGFPGEDDAAFQRTVALLEAFPPMKVHAFPYSEREGTDAASYSHSVPISIRKERVRTLLDYSDAWFRRVAKAYCGTRQPVLIEQHKSDPGAAGHVYLGKLMNYIAVKVFAAEPVIGTICDPSISGIEDSYLCAQI